MKYQVISAFRDQRTGDQIDPGNDLPEGLDRDAIERLVAARCLQPVEPETPAAGQSQSSGSGSAEASDLFAGGPGDGQAEDPGAPAGVGEGEAPPPAAAPASDAPSGRRTRRPAAGGVTS
jgi:hypothetical protein